MLEKKNIWIAGTELIENGEVNEKIALIIAELDLEIISTYISGNNGNGQDLVQIRGSVEKLNGLKKLLKSNLVM